MSEPIQAAADYPKRPIRLIVPYLPGGGTDILARMIAPQLGANLKQHVVIDNRPGGGGHLATETVARSQADGHTLLMAISGIVSAPAVNPRIRYDATRDFTPILLIAKSPYRVVVNPALPANTIQEWFALVKAKPGTMNYGTSGTGTGVHLAVEYFKIVTGTSIAHVPYKGSPPAFADLISGDIQVIFGGTLSTRPHIRSGRLKALAVTSLTRRPDSPELPTISETIAPGYEAGEWFGVFGPPGLTKVLVNRLHTEIARAVNGSSIKTRLVDDGIDVVTGSPDAFHVFIKAESAKWARVVRESGIAPD